MILNYKGNKPSISKDAFVAENATIIGSVEIMEDANIWFGTVIRGDVNKIKIGKGTNIQDNSTIHVNVEGENESGSVLIGDNVTIGHNSVIHGCRIGNECLIGMGSIILNDAEIGDNTIIGAGSVVTSNKKIPSGVLCLGAPAKVIRELTKEEIEHIKESAKNYIAWSKEYTEK